MRQGSVITLLVAAVALLPGCDIGDDNDSTSDVATSADPSELVVRRDALPSGWVVDDVQTARVKLAALLSDVSPQEAALTRSEFVSAYQAGFVSSAAQRSVICAVRVLRSSSAAEQLFELAVDRELTSAREAEGGRVRLEQVTIPESFGDTTAAFEGELRSFSPSIALFAIGWRYRNVLSSCLSLSPPPPDRDIAIRLAHAQQDRITAASS